MRSYSGLLGPVAYTDGFQQLCLPAAPAAGAASVFKVPGDRAYRVLVGTFTLATSATVAARLPSATLADPDGNTLGVFGINGSQAASLTGVYTLSAASSFGGSGNNIQLPDLVLYPGYQLLLGAGALQAADQVSAVRLLVEEFPIGRDGYSLSGLDVTDQAGGGM